MLFSKIFLFYVRVQLRATVIIICILVNDIVSMYIERVKVKRFDEILKVFQKQTKITSFKTVANEKVEITNNLKLKAYFVY